MTALFIYLVITAERISLSTWFIFYFILFLIRLRCYLNTTVYR